MTHGDYKVWKLTEEKREECSLEHQDLRNELKESTQKETKKEESQTGNNESWERVVS